MGEEVELNLDINPPIDGHFSDAEAAAQWVISNFDAVDSLFIEAVEQGEVDASILHAFLVQVGGFGQTLMTDPEHAARVLGRDSFGYLAELVAAVEAGGYPKEVQDDFADGYDGYLTLHALPFDPKDAEMPGWLKGRISRARAKRAEEADGA